MLSLRKQINDIHPGAHLPLEYSFRRFSVRQVYVLPPLEESHQDWALNDIENLRTHCQRKCRHPNNVRYYLADITHCPDNSNKLNNLKNRHGQQQQKHKETSDLLQRSQDNCSCFRVFVFFSIMDESRGSRKGNKPKQEHNVLVNGDVKFLWLHRDRKLYTRSTENTLLLAPGMECRLTDTVTSARFK